MEKIIFIPIGELSPEAKIKFELYKKKREAALKKMQEDLRAEKFDDIIGKL